MTFDEAVLKAARAVFNATPNLSIERFHQIVPSVVVRTWVDEKWESYKVMTINEWRASNPIPEVVLYIGDKDSFGG